MHWKRRSAVAAVAVALACATGPPLTASSAGDGAVVNEDGYRLLNLQLGQLSLADSLEAYETEAGVCVDLKQLVDALDFPISVDAAAGTAVGWFISEDRRFSLAEAKAPAGTVLRSPQGLCVDTSIAAGWFGLTLRPDLPNAVLFATSAEKLPVELAEARKRRRASARPPAEADLSRYPAVDTPYAMWRTPAVDVVADAGYVDDRSRGEKRATGRYELFASGEAAKLSFDARFASNDQAEPESLRLRAFRKDADGGLLGPLKATEVAAGDVVGFRSTLTSEGGFGRGAYVSNQPVDRPQAFDRTDFRGELPAGWDAELYRNGQLIGFADSRADGRYEFLGVPLLFGVNRFEVVLYGQQGQIRRDRRTINVGTDSIQAGKTQYWVGAYQNNKNLLTLKRYPGFNDHNDVRASAVVEHGIDKRTSASLQLHTLAPEALDEDARVTYVEGRLRRVVGAALIELSFASDLDGGLAYGGQLIAEFGKTYVSAETAFARGFVSDRIEPGLNSEHRLSIDHFFDIGKSTLPVGARLTYRDWTGLRPDELEIATRVSTRFAGLSLTHELEWQRFSGGGGARPDDQLSMALLAGGRIGKTRLRGEARYRLKPESQLEAVNIVAERSLGDDGELRGEVGWDSFYDRARFGVGYSRRFERFALGARAEAASDGSFGAGINLAMSFGTNARGGYGRVTANKLASSGQAAARVFTDVNRDGRFDEGEPLHEGVGIAAGTAIAEDVTDAAGTTIVDGLRAFQPQLLSVDASTLADPLLRPASKGIVVVPRPGIAQTVDFALLPTGEVEGMLYMAGKDAPPKPQPGADLELVNASGDVVAETRTDFDGFFLFQDVVYGQYRLRLSEATAKVFGLAQDNLAAVRIDDPDPVVRLGSLTIGGAPVLPLDLVALAADGSVSF